MSIRYKLFLVLGVSQVLLILILSVTFVILIDRVKNEPQDKRAIDQSLAFLKEIQHREEVLKLVLNQITSDDQSIGMLTSGIADRSVLIQNQKYFQAVMKKYNLTIFEIGDRQGKVHFRFHRPEDYGDDKSSQSIIQEALQNKVSATLEVGHSGLGLRVTGPLKNYGTILLGNKVDRKFLNQIGGLQNTGLAVYNGDDLLMSSDNNVDEIIKNTRIKIKNHSRASWKENHYYIVKVPYEDKDLSSLKLDFLVFINETDIKRSTDRIWTIFAFIGILVFAGIFFTSSIFSEDMINAVKSLNYAMRNLEESELKIIDLDRRDEIGQMGSVFVNMKSELIRHQNQLEDMVKAKTDELNESNLQLEKVNKELNVKQKIIEHEMSVAKNLQKHLLPIHRKMEEKLNIASQFIPATMISGDIFDYGKIDEDIFYFFIADASGHGLPAGLVTAMIKTSLSKIKLKKSGPAVVLQQLNADLYPILDDHYFSAIFCKIDLTNNRIIYANGGSPPAILIRPDKKRSILLKPTGKLLGIMEDLEIEEKAGKFHPGDKLFLFTDGISEARNSRNEEFGIEAMNRVIFSNVYRENQKILDRLLSDLFIFTGRESFSDDVSCLLIG